MTAHIVKGGPSPFTSCFINFSTAPIEIVDLSCYTVAFEITPSTEDIDVGVMCAAGLTDVGITTYTAVLTLLWEPALYTLLNPHIGQIGKFTYRTAYPTPTTERVEFNTKYAAQPWGRFEIGQRVEVDLPLAVLQTPVWLAV